MPRLDAVGLAKAQKWRTMSLVTKAPIAQISNPPIEALLLTRIGTWRRSKLTEQQLLSVVGVGQVIQAEEEKIDVT